MQLFKVNAYKLANCMEYYVTPQERAEWDYKTAVGIAEALAKSNVRWVPEIMMGNTSGNNNAMDAVGMNMMLDIVNKMNKK